MIVVSDTSPLTALLTIGHADILQRLFGKVVIPVAVQSELRRSHPTFPAWLEVQAVEDDEKARLYEQTVDRGEAEAIVLAQELHADHLLMDERKGRRLAQRQGIAVVGLLGVVLMAKRAGLIVSARSVVERLDREAGVYWTEELREAALRAVGE